MCSSDLSDASVLSPRDVVAWLTPTSAEEVEDIDVLCVGGGAKGS